MVEEAPKRSVSILSHALFSLARHEPDAGNPGTTQDRCHAKCYRWHQSQLTMMGDSLKLLFYSLLPVVFSTVSCKFPTAFSPYCRGP
jgi:hypothetical protein